MNERSFEAKLKRVSAPAPDAEARLRAKRAALEEFARAHATEQVPSKGHVPSQGLWDALRLFRDDSSHGSTSMAWFVRRNLFAGVASACVVGLGIAMVWPIFSTYVDSRLFEAPRPPVVAQSTPTAALAKSVEPAHEDFATPRPRQKPRAAAAAKPAPAAATAQDKDKEQAEIVVTGMRAQRLAAMEIKREAVGVIDSIAAEDIGTLPDQKLAEPLQRIPGAEVARASQAAAPVPATEEMDEIAISGARVPRAQQAPHKGVAPPAGNGSWAGCGERRLPQWLGR